MPSSTSPLLKYVFELGDWRQCKVHSSMGKKSIVEINTGVHAIGEQEILTCTPFGLVHIK